MKFIDFFSGIGGFRLGMEMAGHECVGHCEIDKYADKSYRAMHNVKEGEWYADDITRVVPGELPDADCYCGGFPCQAFSIAGNRGGFEDTRGTLFFEVMRIADIRKPKYLFLENVKGLLSHDGGRTFGTIINTMGECGYDAEWQVCNSKNFGVPQNRERVFIIGHLRGKSGREVFPIGGQINEYSAIGKSTETAVARTLTAGGHSGGNHSGMTIIKQLNNPTHSNDRVYDDDGLSPCLNTMQGGNRQPFVRTKIKESDQYPKACEKRTDEGLRFFGENIMGCLRTTSECGDKMVMESKHRIRKLTPRECFRLQGFPDDYFDRAKEVNSDSQLYKQAGNSVTVNVICAIAERLGVE